MTHTIEFLMTSCFNFVLNYEEFLREAHPLLMGDE